MVPAVRQLLANGPYRQYLVFKVPMTIASLLPANLIIDYIKYSMRIEDFNATYYVAFAIVLLCVFGAPRPPPTPHHHHPSLADPPLLPPAPPARCEQVPFRCSSPRRADGAEEGLLAAAWRLSSYARVLHRLIRQEGGSRHHLRGRLPPLASRLLASPL